MAKKLFMSYLKIPDAPAFSSPITITAAILAANHPAVPTGLFASDLAGHTDCILSGAFPLGIVINGLTSGLTYRFKNQDASVVIGTSTLATHAIQNVNGSTNIEIYSKSSLEPMTLSAGPGFSGVGWNSSAGGNNIKCVGLVGLNIGYAMFLQSSSTPTSSYALIDHSYCSVNGVVIDGEGEYVGHTNHAPSGFSPVNVFSSIHFLVRNKGREGWQVTHVTNAHGKNITIINVGQSGISGQGNGSQVHDSNGLLENFIVYGCPTPINMFAQGFTFRNGIFCWNQFPGFIGNSADFYAGSPRLNGVEVLFDTIEFLPLFGGVNAAYFAQVQEVGCNFRFLNCKRPSAMTGFLQDIRTPPFTNTITESGTTLATPTTPEFDRLGRLMTKYHYLLHRGAFTPAP